MEETIGYLDKEQDSYETVNLLLGLSFSYIMIGSILEMLFFFLYNRKYHPFKNILVPDTNFVELSQLIIPQHQINNSGHQIEDNGTMDPTDTDNHPK